jgi:hypothetical protein
MRPPLNEGAESIVRAIRAASGGNWENLAPIPVNIGLRLPGFVHLDGNCLAWHSIVLVGLIEAQGFHKRRSQDLAELSVPTGIPENPGLFKDQELGHLIRRSCSPKCGGERLQCPRQHWMLLKAHKLLQVMVLQGREQRRTLAR